MEVMVLNASPRKAGNTAELLKSAADGARDPGITAMITTGDSETEKHIEGRPLRHRTQKPPCKPQTCRAV